MGRSKHKKSSSKKTVSSDAGVHKKQKAKSQTVSKGLDKLKEEIGDKEIVSDLIPPLPKVEEPEEAYDFRSFLTRTQYSNQEGVLYEPVVHV